MNTELGIIQATSINNVFPPIDVNLHPVSGDDFIYAGSEALKLSEGAKLTYLSEKTRKALVVLNTVVHNPGETVPSVGISLDSDLNGAPPEDYQKLGVVIGLCLPGTRGLLLVSQRQVILQKGSTLQPVGTDIDAGLLLEVKSFTMSVFLLNEV